MPLKRLELNNFKSYRGQQTIDFGTSSFTCIIGPNGSGKSNLMDAISFVLGIRSSALRSGQLKELIYRGRKAAEGESGIDELNLNASKKKKLSKKEKKEEEKRKRKEEKEKVKLGKRKAREDDDAEDPEQESEEEEEDDDDAASNASTELTSEEEEDEEQSVDKGAGENDARSAWVMAVYEDEEGHEWLYRRSIALSGSSSYSLNNKPVTAIIYNQSLEKHGILVKARNFLVFQGDVEAVASQNPKELCRLVDQISGSLDLASQYAAAKLANDRATDQASSNYAKKRSMNSEVKQFKEQKDEVRKWQASKLERSNLIVEHLVWRLWHIEEKIEEAQEAVEEGRGKLEPLKETVGKEEKKVEKVKKEQAEANLKLKKQEGVVKAATKALEAKRPDLLTLETQMEHAKKKIASTKLILTSVRKDEARQSETVEGLKRSQKDAEEAAKVAAEAQRLASAKKGVELNQADLAEYRTLRAKANNQSPDERKQLEGLQRDLKRLKDALRSTKDKVEQAESKKATLTDEAGSFEQKHEELEVRLQTLNEERTEARSQLAKLQTERSRISQLETEANEHLQEVYNKLLQARIDKQESQREVKMKETLANLKRVFPGVRGRVIDLCKPAQEKYGLAIQTVLGRHIDSVVVDHERTAIECIEYMRNQRAGQATFIPLDTIQIKSIGEKIKSIAADPRNKAKIAVDCIVFDPPLERAMHHACGDAMICENSQRAKNVGPENGVDVKVVTLEGTVFHRSGLITGGQGGEKARTWQKEELQVLERKREGLMNQLADYAKQKPRSNNDDSLLGEVQRLEGIIATVKDELSSAAVRLQGLRAEVKHVDKTLKGLKPELQKQEKAIQTHDSKIKTLETTVQAVDDNVFAQFCRKIGVADIREYENVQLKMAQQETEARMRYDTLIAKLKIQIKFEESQLQNTRERLATLQTIIDKEEVSVNDTLASQQETLQEEIKQAEEELETHRSKLEKLQVTAAEKSTTVDLARAGLNKAVREHDGVLKEIGAQNDTIEKQASERFAIYRRCKLEEISLPLESGTIAKVPIEENMQAESQDSDSLRPKTVKDFGIVVDYSGLDDDARADSSAELSQEYENRIATLATDIEKMAPNLRAIEKLNDVENKLKDTEREAAEASTEAKKARDEFNEIKKQRCDLFKKAFDHISGCIDSVYKELTKGATSPTGGVAYLNTEDEDEPYLSGIKYHAMPPMKRFRDMEQLSGGEKTMAALALLFAIHSFQPSPFFVLDEVDAALDNTNVARIATYVRRHCGPKFQFIVISLKGSLYERANSLVGIYRDQDANSSQSLTLDLQQYDE